MKQGGSVVGPDSGSEPVHFIFDPRSGQAAQPLAKDEWLNKLLSAGVAGFVLKRSAATDLIPAVKEVLRGGTYVCPALQGLLPESGDQSPTEAKGAPPVE